MSWPAGILYGLVGGVLKVAVHAAILRPAAAVATWPAWTLGAWALVVHQRVYTHAPPHVSLPALSVGNPLAALVFGATVFGEKPASRPLALLAEAGASRSSLRRSRCWRAPAEALAAIVGSR